MIKVSDKLKNFKRPSDHSTFSPSSMDRFINCPASLRLCSTIPQEDEQDYSREGTLAHKVAENYFYAEMLGAQLPKSILDEASAWKSYDEMISGAQAYTSELETWLNHIEVGNVLWYGLEVATPIIPEEGCFGTSDCVIVGDRSCVIIDYKFGRKKVHADSLQLRAYAAGILAHLENVPDDYRIYSVIVQPRVDFASTVHCYSKDQVEEFFLEIKSMIERAKDPSEQPMRGDKKHCFWCPASRTKDPAHKCPAIKRELDAVSAEDFRGYLIGSSGEIETLGPNAKRDAALIKLIAIAPVIEQAAKKAKEEFEFRFERGEKIEGFEMKEVLGNRVWRYDDERIATMLEEEFEKIKGNAFKTVPETKKLLTITEVEKIVGKNKIDSLIVRPIKKELCLIDEKELEIRKQFLDYVED